MRIALSASAIRHADELAMTRARMPSMDLMEAAGRETAHLIHRSFSGANSSRVAIVCGTGNNGGDGFVIARYLHDLGYSVDVFTHGDPNKYSSDTATNFRKIQKLTLAHPDSFGIRAIKDGALMFETTPDCIVDSLLGTGLEKNLRPQARAIVDTINAANCLKVAVDVPSGLDASTGAVLGAVIKSDLTVTMAALKTGILVGAGPDVCGEVHVVDIGITRTLLEEAGEMYGMAFIPDDEDIRPLLPRRNREQHKYSVGVLGIVGGSTGLTGAPVMASLAAYRGGVGAVICATPEEVEPVIAAESHETMTIPLPTGADGLQQAAADIAINGLAKATALLIGPGLGRQNETGLVVQTVLKSWQSGVILDADAFHAIAEEKDGILGASSGRFVLTPHEGEFRLLGSIGENRIDSVREFATANDVVLVLKGAPTLVGCPDGRVFISTAGSGCFTKAGFGDVLAGMIGAFYAQGLLPTDAALCALHLGGRTAERYTSTRSKLSFMPSDLIAELPAVIYDFEN